MSLVSPKNILQEYCRRNNLSLPVYSSYRENGMWISSVVCNSIVAIGVPSLRKIDSDNSCALTMMERLTGESAPRELPLPVEERLLNRSIQTKWKFVNNIFDESLLHHLGIVVQGKEVEITNEADYRSSCRIVIYLLAGRTEIVSMLKRNSVRIEFPIVPYRDSFQSMMIQAMCMELGAESCSVIGMFPNEVHRAIVR